MAFKPEPGEQYTIRRHVFRLLGAGFHIYDPSGKVVGFCKQKSFRLKEDLRIYTDESMTVELMRIGARSVLDFGATYVVLEPDGDPIGSARRKGLRSLLRDEWELFDAAGRLVAAMKEESTLLAFLRRSIDLVAALSPQKFIVTATDGAEVARFRQHFHPFIYRLGVTLHAPEAASTPAVDDRLLLAAAVLVAAIEGRQG